MPRGLSRVASAVAAAALLCVVSATPAGAARDTVTISGKAYRFNHMDTYIAGATIRVRELPKVSAVTDAAGDYELEVPDDTTVTPYIEPGDPYNQIDLQTFHTRGEDIENANFQTPHDDEYGALAALLGVPIGPDGRPTGCVVVSTVSDRDVRGVPYETFHERTPHGVAGATARAFPAVPGPVYFNELVIPDRAETETSEDGGVIWESVPAGAFRFVASHPDRRFASFLATCEPGRIVNANPPWGLYELSPGEEPLGAGIVAASLDSAKAKRAGGGTKVVARLDSAEALDAVVEVRRKGKKLGSDRFRDLDGGSPKLAVKVGGSASGRAKVIVRMTDAAGEKASDSARVEVL
ncbi:MAG TPA: hypothetical protein VFY99_00915 [Solirubrobacterales bacterium]